MYKIVFFILLFLLICGFIYYFTFCKYPELIYGIVTKTSGYDASADKLGRGTYGDMYGALNTFFSGIAFIGLLVTIAVQIYIHNKERSIDIKKQDRAFRDSLHYICCLFIDAIGIINNHKESFEIFISNKESNIFDYTGFKIGSFISRLSTINEKIDQEKYFIAYRNYFNDYDIIPVFENFTMIQNVCELSIKQINQYETALKEGVNSLEPQLSNFLNEYNRLKEIEPMSLITIDDKIGNLIEKMKFQESTIVFGTTNYTLLKNILFELHELINNLFFDAPDNKLDFLHEMITYIVNQYKLIENNHKMVITSLKANIGFIEHRKVVIDLLIKKLQK